MGWWKRYAKDTLTRLEKFDKLRTDTYQLCLSGDSRNIDIVEEMKRKNPRFADMLYKKK